MYDQPPLAEAESRLCLDFMRESVCNIMKQLGPLPENWEFIGTGRDHVGTGNGPANLEFLPLTAS